MKAKTIQKIIPLSKVDFDSIDEKDVDLHNVSKYARVFSEYRSSWKAYGKAKKSGQNVAAPNFPLPAISVRCVAGWYSPTSPDDWAAMLAAKKSKINRVVVAVEEPVCDNSPIHANDFFGSFKAALRLLQATDPQRVELFKPLVLALLHEGIDDRDCRAEFLDWLDEMIVKYR